MYDAGRLDDGRTWMAMEWLAGGTLADRLTERPWPFEQRFHVTFLRNVLYYFAPPTRRAVVEACFDAAEPGGWLVTSLTEPMLDLVTRWTQVRPGVFRRGSGP